MPHSIELLAHQYAAARKNLQNWREVKTALNDDLRGDLSRRIESGIRTAQIWYDIAERQLFDVFDVATSNLVYGTADFSTKERRGRLLKRAQYHEDIAKKDNIDPEHAEMHQRVAEQLRDLADKPRRTTL